MSTLITDPAVIADQKRRQTHQRVQRTGRPDECPQRVHAVLNGIEEAKEIIANETDAEMREMAREELDARNARQPELEEEISPACPRRPAGQPQRHSRNPRWCRWRRSRHFAGDLFRMYTKVL